MSPIVDGLEQTYSESVMFQRFNARDGAEGQALFESLALPGHPSYVVTQPDGTETFRAFGIVEESALVRALESARVP
jgi:thiol:disulfide interchange protein